MPSSSSASRSTSRGLQPEPDWLNEERARFTTTSATYADGIYAGVSQDDDIERFLEESGHYDTSKGRWFTAEGSADVEDLIDSLAAILSSIVQRFVVSDEPGVENAAGWQSWCCLRREKTRLSKMMRPGEWSVIDRTCLIRLLPTATAQI